MDIGLISRYLLLVTNVNRKIKAIKNEYGQLYGLNYITCEVGVGNKNDAK